MCSAGDPSKVAKNHAKRLVSNMLRFNHSFSSLEPSADIVNSTPNASIRIPATKYKLKKIMQKDYSFEYNIKCSHCQNYSVTAISGRRIECGSCSEAISTSFSEFFVYIPLEQQLKKVIFENFEEIDTYPSRQDETSISDVHDCLQYKKVSKKYSESKVISLVVCADGVKLFNSSRKSLWAIHLYLNCLKPVRRYIPDSIIVVALYVGEHKPNMQDFLFPLMIELNRIKDSGGIVIQKDGKSLCCMPIITHCSCDLPAKAEVQGMVGHAGYYACGFCLHPGIAVKKSKQSKSYVRYVNRKRSERPRTHESMVQIYDKLTASSKSIDGVKSISCMIGSEDFDLVNGFAIDYMHCVLLGITSKVLDLWLNSCNHKQSYYMNPKKQEALNERIIKIKPTSEISRKPRPIFERADYKANELRSFLLYYLPISLPGLLSKPYIDNFLLLSSACYILLKEVISKEEIDLAEERLIKFSNDFESLYGSHNITLNIHLVKHMGSAVRNLGPLWAQSLFGMEANNGIINKITSKKFPVHSIAWKYCAREKNINKKVDEPKITILEKATTILTQDEVNAIAAKFPVEYKQTIYKSVSLSGKRYTSKKSKETASIDYFIELLQGKVGMVKFYIERDYIIYGLLELYEVVECMNQFSTVKATGISELFEISKIKRKLIYMKIVDKEFTTSIPNRFEKT